MRATFGDKTYTVGLTWRLAAGEDDIREALAETGLERGVVLRDGAGRIAGVGLTDDADRRPPPAAAALLALHYASPVLAVERAASGAVWLAAVQDGIVVPGTDLLADDPAELERHVDELRREADYRLIGTASTGYGGSGESALRPAQASRALQKAAIRGLGRTAGPVQIALLSVLLVGVGVGLWLFLQPGEPAVPATPVVDRQAEQRRQAIAERNRLLSADLSGVGPRRLVQAAWSAGRPYRRSAAYWRRTLSRCDGGGCTLFWRAMVAGAIPDRLATALGVPRERIGSDTRADQVSLSEPLGLDPERIVADEGTRLSGRLPRLIDLCREYRGRGGGCTLEPAQAVAIPNASLLPPGLAYRKGRLVLDGPLGAREALLTLFDGADLSPWVRADGVEFDPDRLVYRLEAHYVLP